jgi:hypothetical protein
VALALLGLGCATTHQVRPLGRGNAAVHASVGGPLLGLFGGVLPVPVVSVGGGYGVSDTLDVTLHLDVTSAAFGALHIDPGVAWHPLISEGGPRPTLTLGGSLHVLTDFTATLVAPDLMLAAAWRIARRHLVYAGVDAALAVRTTARALGGPFLGGEVRLGKRLGLALELKWLAPWYDTAAVAPSWIAPGGYGYLSALLGVNVYIGNVK